MFFFISVKMKVLREIEMQICDINYANFIFTKLIFEQIKLIKMRNDVSFGGN